MLRRIAFCMFLILAFGTAHAWDWSRKEQRAVYGVWVNPRVRKDATIQDWLGGKAIVALTGSAVATGPYTLTTATHCMRFGGPYLALNAEGGQDALEARKEPFNPFEKEKYASTYSVDEQLPVWLECAAPKRGFATVYTLAGEHEVLIFDPPSQILLGWRPYQGSSGSPVVQNGKVVGVIIQQACDPKDAWGYFAFVVPIPE